MQTGSMKPRILVVEDDERTAASVALYLRHGGYDVTTASTGREALEEIGRAMPDLLVLDLMLPEVNGLEVCRVLRQQSQVPVIMLTARSTERDTLDGLAAGADDYVTKPFSPRELVARVAAVLRRSRPVQDVVSIGDVEIDRARRTVRRDGSLVALTPAEYAILDVLASSPGRAFTRAELGERAFGHDYDALDRTIDAHVMNLRRKIEPDRTRPRLILTAFGIGYRMGSPE
jgi:DNA-binding response OmpR family regulator